MNFFMELINNAVQKKLRTPFLGVFVFIVAFSHYQLIYYLLSNDSSLTVSVRLAAIDCEVAKLVNLNSLWYVPMTIAVIAVYYLIISVTKWIILFFENKFFLSFRDSLHPDYIPADEVYKLKNKIAELNETSQNHDQLIADLRIRNDKLERENETLENRRLETDQKILTLESAFERYTLELQKSNIAKELDGFRFEDQVAEPLEQPIRSKDELLKLAVSIGDPTQAIDLLSHLEDRTKYSPNQELINYFRIKKNLEDTGKYYICTRVGELLLEYLLTQKGMLTAANELLSKSALERVDNARIGSP